MNGSLEGPVAKLGRAYLQGTRLQEQIRARFPPATLWPVSVEEHRRGLEYRFYLGDIPDVDPDWPMAVSEILFNARSALDYLAYQLHERRYRGKIPRAVGKASMFPIYDSPTAFGRYGAPRIKKLSERDKRAIRNLQPYVTRNDGWKYARINLSRLSSLQNFDKHRKLHLISTAAPSSFDHEWPESCGFNSETPRGAVKSGDHVQTWTFTSSPPEMKDHRGVLLVIALEHEGELVDLRGMLGEVINHVSLVIERFADRFPRVPRPLYWRPDWWATPLEPGAHKPPTRSIFLPR
jgi:hypothetical protein